MEKSCENCKNKGKFEEVCITLCQEEENKPYFEPKTKGDGIREMNDEELAEFLIECAKNNVNKFRYIAKESVLKWLQQPRKERNAE